MRRRVRNERTARWQLADLLVHAQENLKLSLEQLAGETGYSYGYVRNLMSVARRVPIENRDIDVSWDVYAAGARVKSPEKQRDALEAAAREGLDGARLAARLRATSPPVGSQAPDPKRERNPRNDLWAALMDAGLTTTGRLNTLIWRIVDCLDNAAVVAILREMGS